MPGETNRESQRKTPARERLLATASELFYQRGYSEVGIDEIIRESGIAKATFYHHFSSKERLVESWLQSIHDAAMERHLSILKAPGSAIEKIASSFDSLKTHLEGADYRGCPYSNSCAVTTPENILIRHQIESHKEATREFYYRLTHQEIADRDSAIKLADQIFLLYSGATTEAQNLRQTWPVDIAKDTATTLCQMAFG